MDTIYISDSTKNGEHYNSALDHFYCSSDKIFSNFKKLIISMSDHRHIVCSLPLKTQKKKVVARFTLSRSWMNSNDIGFLLDLVNQPWEQIINEGTTVHQQAEIFQELLESTLNRHTPLRKVKIRPYFKKGLSAQTKELIKIRNYTLNKRKLIRAQYKRLRNELTSRSIK